MGLRLTKLEPVHGFAAETAAASAIELASRLGIPVSTTHTINTAIMGVGSTRRLSAVRWGVGREIVTAWVLTFPACGALAWAAAAGLAVAPVAEELRWFCRHGDTSTAADQKRLQRARRAFGSPRFRALRRAWLLDGDRAIDVAMSLAVITLLFAMIFKILPDVKVAWGDVWIGAAATAVLFTLGKLAIGFYLGHSDVGSAYGAAGSLIVILVWIYYSAQILFLGAEFTQVYANRYGSRIRPDRDAEPVTEEMRAQQGMPVRRTESQATQYQSPPFSTTPQGSMSRSDMCRLIVRMTSPTSFLRTPLRQSRNWPAMYCGGCPASAG